MMSRTRLGGLLFLAALIIVGLVILSMTRIIIVIPLGLGSFLLLVLGLVLVVYFLLRSLFRR
jgi:hypothetical protein